VRILVTGREGQVARSLVERARLDAGIEIVTAGRPELDLAEPETVGQVIRSARPDLVVSAAAYTAVDRAEDEPALAHAVNATGAGAVAEAARAAGAPVIHLSTDYVFAGDAEHPYAEDDAPSPIGAYGKSKLAGEQAVIAAHPDHVILRTAWVYSPFGHNFVRTMLRLAGDRDEIAVVGDQWGNPTSALDIADAVLHIARSVAKGAPEGGFGIFHLAGTGRTNWSGFAGRLFELSAALGGPSAKIRTITTAEYPTRATRPANSCLSTDKLWNVYGWRAPQWQASAKAVVARLLSPQG
jgi:dTDP-4-dehydrorhamnose reductase